jgi:hypothetical protein
MQNELLMPKNRLSLKDFFRVKKAESEEKSERRVRPTHHWPHLS